MRASVVLVVTFALFGGGLALKCYRCAPSRSGLKDYPTCDQQDSMDCPAEVTGCVTAYINGKENGKEGIYKGCLDDTVGVELNFTGCVQEEDGKLCACQGPDLCNLKDDVQPTGGAPANTTVPDSFSAQTTVSAYLGLFLLLLVLM
ncbi:hypothetical protein M3Y94_00905800 [Aphelenchoides besseyi]|nr:hypothetical protein M3Y94_00905800 [Aphelenchoides besseyi]KAI6223314.1 hypothetical protein M3Y95_00876600 [Aphelenchoides besseyi]